MISQNGNCYQTVLQTRMEEMKILQRIPWLELEAKVETLMYVISPCRVDMARHCISKTGDCWQVLVEWGQYLDIWRRGPELHNAMILTGHHDRSFRIGTLKVSALTPELVSSQRNPHPSIHPSIPPKVRSLYGNCDVECGLIVVRTICIFVLKCLLILSVRGDLPRSALFCSNQ